MDAIEKCNTKKNDKRDSNDASERKIGKRLEKDRDEQTKEREGARAHGMLRGGITSMRDK